MRLMLMAFALSILFAACSGTNQVMERKDPHSYTLEKKAEARAKIDQRRMDRENYKQLKRNERASNRQNHRGWDNNQLGNVFGL